MKTTIEIPDDVAKRAKISAAQRGVTLRALMLQGLERVLEKEPLKASDRASKLFAAMDEAAGITAGRRLNRSEANER